MTKDSIEFIYTPIINFAMQQSHVPIIRKLSIINPTEDVLEGIKVTLHSDPTFLVEWEHYIDTIQPGGSFVSDTLGVQVSSAFLAELTEKITGNLYLSVSKNEEILFSNNFSIEVLPYDHWNGIPILPELLTCFVTPNHPGIPEIIRKAAIHLQQWTGNPSFDEYQSRSEDRVKKQMAAIYQAITELNIIYASVPASFEETGQRIRMCDTLFSTQLGNCLDLSLLYASCLEAVGIHSLIIIVKGHAFAGAWLTNESFSDPVNDDVSLLTKRTAPGINEIMLIECTCMNAGKLFSFDQAVESANYKLIKEEDFILFIDVKRARFAGIRPLPLRIAREHGWELISDSLITDQSDSPEEIFRDHIILETGQIEVSKQKLWERKLLDLTLRNSLLNLRISKSTLQFIGINLPRFEDALSAGDEFQILAKPNDWENPLRNAGVYQMLHQSDPVLDLIKSEFSQKRLRTYLSETELSASILQLYRSSRVSLEENGANTLYIALGVLRWYETSLSEKPRYAPVLLLPVEIIKKSAQKGFIIRTREEETVFNITLLEMLRQDFGIQIGGMDNLPKDDSGVDVKAVFNILRHAIMDKKGWDIEEQSFLATFSFSKFVLWNDIHNNADQLLKNKLVKSLVSGKLEWIAQTPELLDLDYHVHPTQVPLPINSDASQLRAIVTANRGESFVLHGPPGTGKSQTITNIIANALYQGKKVLFVSSKKAALDVVHTRLQSIGVGDFCLELHSNKAKKSAVLDQLKRATEVSKKRAREQYAAEADRLFNLRQGLSQYIDLLHQPTGYELTLFDLLNSYCETDPSLATVPFSPDIVRSLTTKKLNIWHDLVEDLHVAAKICNQIHKHPLEAVNASLYSQQLKVQVEAILVDLEKLLNRISSEITYVQNALLINIPISTQKELESLCTLTDLFKQLPDCPSTLFAIEQAEQNLSQIKAVAIHGQKRDELKAVLSEEFQQQILTICSEQLLNEWNQATQKWFIPRFFKQNAIVKSVRKYSISGKTEKQRIPEILALINAYKTEQAEIDKNADLPAKMQYLWKNGECDWKNLIIICEIIIKINRVYSVISSPSNAAEWRQKLSLSFTEGTSLYLSKYLPSLEDLSTTSTAIFSRIDLINKLLLIDHKYATGSDNWIDTLSKQVNIWLNHLDSLKDWMNWVAIRDCVKAEGLSSLIEACETGQLEVSEIVATYKKSLYQSCIQFIIDDNEILSSFNGEIFEDRIRKFKEISITFERLTREELFARLSARIPDFTIEAAQSSEIGLLQKAIKNGGRGMSLRKLFDTIPNILSKLTPCMLMSPISVSQYFDTSDIKFDLLVFDEASQLPTCEAVGAIARAENVIIVGDPKQMPPTSFFSSNNFDEDNIDKEDLESILDDCLALSMPSSHLSCHYRSRHESLIAFSNAKYYENRLLTFPSIDDIVSKVSFVQVNGFYETKGRNRAEAIVIVEEILRRLQNPIESAFSIGVVTFNQVQQNLIEDLLNEEFKNQPELEKIALESQEPLFIKNLENVQGDERDVILFSITYGKNEQGKLNMNFGPLNKEGGWRRLNVAVSRARHEMKVFSTMTSSDIDLRRTNKKGVIDLKDFLAFAEKGKISLTTGSNPENADGSSFVKRLATEIEKNGFKVHTGIGCSAYKIDIGILHPEKPNEYLLGILCDGYNYLQAQTMRDREITQPQILNRLGWNLIKTWSLDWWENPEKVIFRIISAARDILKNGKLVEPSEVSESPQLNHQVEAESVYLPEAKLVRTYQKAQLDIVLSRSSEEFLFDINKRKIISQIRAVMDTEAPISKTLLCKRVLSAWGIARNGARISSYFDLLFSEMAIHEIKHGTQSFLWNYKQYPLAEDHFRIAIKEDDKRDADDLPPEEVANAVAKILREQISLTKVDLVREAAKIFGFAKVGGNVDGAMNAGINYLITLNRAKEQNSRILLL